MFRVEMVRKWWGSIRERFICRVEVQSVTTALRQQGLSGYCCCLSAILREFNVLSEEQCHKHCVLFIWMSSKWHTQCVRNYLVSNQLLISFHNLERYTAEKFQISLQ
jgi:hypothetical protein